jgi:hypothetical protein
MKDAQATGEPSVLEKEHPTLQKLKICTFFRGGGGDANRTTMT